MLCPTNFIKHKKLPLILFYVQSKSLPNSATERRISNMPGTKLYDSELRASTGFSRSKNTKNWKTEVDKALIARLNHLETQNEKQKDMIRSLKQENAKLKSEHYKKSVAKEELKRSRYGGPWSEAQLELILNYPLSTSRKRKAQSVKWSSRDIVKGIILFEKLCTQGL